MLTWLRQRARGVHVSWRGIWPDYSETSFQVLDLLFQKLARDSAKRSSAGRDEKLVLRVRTPAPHRGGLLHAFRGGLGAVDDAHFVADDALDRSPQNRVMRAAEDEGTIAGVDERLE